jgi:hypothetical protein
MTHYITKSLQLVYNCTCIHIGQGEAPLPLLIFETYNPCKQTKKKPQKGKIPSVQVHTELRGIKIARKTNLRLQATKNAASESFFS